MNKAEFHLKVITGTIALIEKLEEFCKGNIKVDEYHTFFSVIIDKEALNYGCLFNEEKYSYGNYGVTIFDRDNFSNEIFIPVKFIDCIYSL